MSLLYLLVATGFMVAGIRRESLLELSGADSFIVGLLMVVLARLIHIERTIERERGPQ